MEQDVTTITISIVEQQIVVTPSESESGKAVGRKNGRVQWQGDSTVTGMWVVGLKGPGTPFVNNRMAFTQSGTGMDGAKIRGDANNGDQFPYSVFCETAEGALFLDPIVVIRDSTKSYETLMVELTEEQAAATRLLAAQAEGVAEMARTGTSASGSIG